MLGLKVEDDFLDLDVSTTLNITMMNPLFDVENIARSFSYPFKIPLTNKNKKILHHSERIDRKSPQQKIEAKLYIGGNRFEYGILEIKKYTEKYSQVVFRNRDFSLLTELEALRIKDTLGYELINSTASIETNPTFDIVQSDGSISGSYYIIIEGIAFLLNTNTSMTAEFVAEWFYTEINLQLPNHAIWSPGQTQLILDIGELPPFHFFLFNIGFIPSVNVTSSQSHALNTEFYVKDINQNSVATHAFPVLRWNNFYEDNPIFEKWINYCLDEITIQNDLETERQWKHTYIPFVRLKYVVERIISAVGYRLSNNHFWNDVWTQELLIFNNRAIDRLVVPFNTQEQFINSFQTIISFADHVPDLSGKDFLFFIAEQFGLYLSFDGGLISFVSKNDQVTKQAVDWTKKSEPQYVIDEGQEKGYILQQRNQYDEYQSQEQLLPYRIGNGSQEILLPFGSAYMGYHNTLYIPHIQQAGSFNASSTRITGIDPATGVAITETDTLEADNSYDLRLLSYQGMVSDINGALYPQATNEGLSPANIHEKYHRSYLALLNNKTVSKAIRLRAHELQEIRRWKNSKRRIYHDKGEIEGIIKSVNFKVSTRKIEVANVELVAI